MRDVNTDGGIVTTGIAHCSHLKVQACHNAVCTCHMIVTYVKKSKPDFPKLQLTTVELRVVRQDLIKER